MSSKQQGVNTARVGTATPAGSAVSMTPTAAAGSKKRKSTSASGGERGGGPKKKAARRKTKQNPVGPSSAAAAAAAGSMIYSSGQQHLGGGHQYHAQHQQFGGAAATAAQRAAKQAATAALSDRANAAAADFERRNDSAWLAKDNIATAVDTHRIHEEQKQRQQQHSNASIRQRRANTLEFLKDESKIVDRALNACGFDKTQVTQEGYACLLEYSRRNACELVADAQDYAKHCSRHEINSADLKLASWNDQDDGDGILTKSWYLPPLDKLSELSEQQNKIPLPPIPSNCYNGIALPPLENQVTARTFDVVSSARASHRFISAGINGSGVLILEPSTSRSTQLAAAAVAAALKEPTKEGEKKQTANNNDDAVNKNNSNKTGSYGANKGKPISVTIGGVTSGPSKQQMNDAVAATSDVAVSASETVSAEAASNDLPMPDISEQF